MSSGPKIYLDGNLLVQLIDVLQLRQKDDPIAIAPVPCGPCRTSGTDSSTACRRR